MLKRSVLTFLLWMNFFFLFPCGWDSDTIAMEKRMFPSVHELITGKFLQHSQEFYYWRVADRKEKIQLYPDSLNYYDDLAWALNKIGEPEKGIDIMLEKEKKKPGLYKTYANLGTCYIHAGQHEEGLKYIKKAIKINPDAHFGREIYQQHLVEYVISKKDASGKFKLPLGTKDDNFFHYLKKNHFSGSEKNEIAKAVKGVGGMMKFSNHNSPVLLEALGDLLSNADSGTDPGAGHLSSRAYLKAALLSKDTEIADAYRKKARTAIERVFPGHIPVNPRHDPRPDFAHAVISIKDLETVLKLEIQAANAWAEEIRKNELEWIESGVNPDSAFTAMYYEEPSSDHINQYNARKNKEQIEEEYWLSVQLENISEINNMYSILELPDSTKNWVDSIYKVEFSTLPEETESTEDTASKKNQAKNKSGFPTWGYFLGAAILLILIPVVRIVRSKRN